MSGYGYICPADKQLHVVPPGHDVVVSGEQVEVQCEVCNGEWHPCRPLAELRGHTEPPICLPPAFARITALVAAEYGAGQSVTISEDWTRPEGATTDSLAGITITIEPREALGEDKA